MLLAADEQLVDAETATVRRRKSGAAGALAIKYRHYPDGKFAGHYVGALGGKGDHATFDALSREGLLFARFFFSSGTYTHRGYVPLPWRASPTSRVWNT